MYANGRWDLIRRLKVKLRHVCYTVELSDWFRGKV
jgi:hypothetical protein